MECVVSDVVVYCTVCDYSLCVMNAIRQLHLLIVTVRWIAIVLMLIGVVAIPYAVGQWIDGDNFVYNLTVKPFWIYQLRECNAC